EDGALVEFDGWKMREVLARAAGEIVEDDDASAELREGLGDVRADESGAAGDETLGAGEAVAVKRFPVGVDGHDSHHSSMAVLAMHSFAGHGRDDHATEGRSSKSRAASTSPV